MKMFSWFRSGDERAPRCLSFDNVREVSDFGTQVVNLIELDADTWRVSDNFTEFSHPKLGTFAVLHSGHVLHLGMNGRRRALTGGDQQRILESLRVMLLKPLPLDAKEVLPDNPYMQLDAARIYRDNLINTYERQQARSPFVVDRPGSLTPASQGKK